MFFLIRQKALSLWMRLFWLRDEVTGSLIKFGIVCTVLSFLVDLHRSAPHSTVVARRFVKRDRKQSLTLRFTQRKTYDVQPWKHYLYIIFLLLSKDG